MDEFELRRQDHLDRVRRLAASLPDGTCISHASAALALGLPLYAMPSAVVVTRDRGRGARTSDVHVHVAQLRAADVVEVDGIPVTSPARTVVDLARRLPFMAGLVVADGAMRRGVTRRGFSDTLRHQWTWPGVRHAAIAVRHADPRAETALESVVRARVILLRLPIPRLQVNIFGESGWVGRVDFDWEAYGVVGEADGRIKYLEDELWREKVRQDELEDAGREVIRWTWRTAHAPDAEFRARLLRKFERGRHMRALRRTG